MGRATLLTSVGLFVSLVLAAFVQAITFGENDNGRHPFVGSLVAEVQGTKFQACSGTLVSPTIWVTAGHCLFGAEEAGIPLWVTFDEVIDADADGVVDPTVTLPAARRISTLTGAFHRPEATRRIRTTSRSSFSTRR